MNSRDHCLPQIELYHFVKSKGAQSALTHLGFNQKIISLLAHQASCHCLRCMGSMAWPSQGLVFSRPH